MTLCVKCKTDTSDVHSIRNGTLQYCDDCLIAASRKRVRLALVEALSPRSLELSCRLAVAVGSARMDGSSGWCAWHLLSEHVTYKKMQGLNVEAVHVRFVTSDEKEHGGGIEEAVGSDSTSLRAHRVITMDGRVLESVVDPTGREDLRRILVRHALKQQLGCHDKGQENRYDCIVLGETADALAACAVSRAAKGQGHLLGDVGISRDGFAYVMRELGKDWVAAYAKTIPGAGICMMGQTGDGAAAPTGDHKNVNDLARVFAAQLLESNPGGVSNVLGTLGKLKASPGKRTSGGCLACALCDQVLVEDEVSNRYGVCDACTTGVFGDWRDEERARQTVDMLPNDLRARLLQISKFV